MSLTKTALSDEPLRHSRGEGRFNITESSTSLVFLLLSVLGAVGLGVHLFLPPKHDTSETQILVFVLLSFYVITEKLQAFFAARDQAKLLSGLQQNIARISNELDDKTAKLIEMMGHSIEAKCIGSHADALLHCAGRLKNAHRLKDTFFRTQADQTLIGHRREATAFLEAELEFLKRGGSMEYLVSEVNFEIARDINKDIIAYVLENKAFVQWQGFRLEHGRTPVINMIILEFDDFREVLFGWNYSNTDDGIVFSSKKEKVVRYFTALFERTRFEAKRFSASEMAIITQNPDDAVSPQK